MFQKRQSVVDPYFCLVLILTGFCFLVACRNAGEAPKQLAPSPYKNSAGMAMSMYNPDAIREVARKERREANAVWWGFDPEDATVALQEAIRSGADRIIVPNMGTAWHVRPISLESGQEIVFKPGVVIEAFKGEFQGGGDNLFKAVNKHDIRLTGAGAVFRMHKRDYTKAPYTPSQWRHAIALHGCRNIKIAGLAIYESGGDGIYIGRGIGENAPHYCENIHIKNVTLAGHHRQGISVVSAQNLFIEGVKIHGTRGTAPQAGIDFEPNKPDERLSLCLLRNCEISGNRGVGILFYLSALKAESYPVSVTVETCRVKRNKASVWIFGIKDNPTGKIAFSGNDFGLLKYGRGSVDLQVVYKYQPGPTLPPSADAGGPYLVEYGKTVQLDASGSFDRDGDGGVIDWMWDLNMDGAAEPLYGDKPVATWRYLVEDLGLSPGNSYPIALKVLDDDYEWSGTATAELRIEHESND
jgi:hypothetical protein